MGGLLGNDGKLLSSGFEAASTGEAAGPGVEGEETEDSREPQIQQEKSTYKEHRMIIT